MKQTMKAANQQFRNGASPFGGRSASCCVDFGAVIRVHLDDLAAFSSRHVFDRGEAIYRAGDPADALFAIETGRVKLLHVSAEGREKVIEIAEPSGFFGELCLCEVAGHPHTAVALELTRVVRYDVKAVNRLLASRPELTREFLKMVCTRLVDCQEQVAELTFNTVARRLAQELLHLSRRSSREGEDGLVRLEAMLTHEDLAGLVGSSREVVTSLMNQFRRRGLVDYGRRAILVSPEALDRFVEGRFATSGPSRRGP